MRKWLPALIAIAATLLIIFVTIKAPEIEENPTVQNSPRPENLSKPKLTIDASKAYTATLRTTAGDYHLSAQALRPSE